MSDDTKMPRANILLVDDEDNLRSMLDAALSHHGFTVDPAANGRTAIEKALAAAPDLILLDVMMPGLDGFEVARRLRNDTSSLPILFLTARDATEDKVRGLTLGGDDYLTKPFSLEELVARVNSLLRRSGTESASSAVLSYADLILDDDAHRVTRAGVEIRLSPTEFDLLRFLLTNQGRVMSKAQILDHVWHFDFDGDGGIVETYVGYLRRKIDHDEPRLIHTIRGVGYTLRVKS